MRYSNDESTVLVGTFETGKTIKIKVLNIVTDTLVSIKNNNCVESNHIEGVYLWPTNNIENAALKSGYHNLIYCMYDDTSGKRFYGKFVYGGFVDKEVTFDTSGLEVDLTEIKEITELINARI